MTRQEFIDEVNDWYDLIEFCNNENLYNCEYIMDSDVLDDYVNSDIYERMRSGESWKDIYEYLDDIPQDYDYYDTEYGVEGLTHSDFEDRKQDVLDEMDEDDRWDEEEPEEEDEEDEEDGETGTEVPEPEDETVTEDELFALFARI